MKDLPGSSPVLCFPTHWGRISISLKRNWSLFQDLVWQSSAPCCYCDEACLAGTSYHAVASASRSSWTSGGTSGVRKRCCWPQQSANINCWNMSNAGLDFHYSYYFTFFILDWCPKPSHTYAGVTGLPFPPAYVCKFLLKHGAKDKWNAFLFSREPMNLVFPLSLNPWHPPLPSMTGADHHHVYLRLSQRLSGARLPLRSKGSHHPVSAPEKRGLAQGHGQPLQRHSVCFCLRSQLQLLERYQLPSQPVCGSHTQLSSHCLFHVAKENVSPESR